MYITRARSPATTRHELLCQGQLAAGIRRGQCGRNRRTQSRRETWATGFQAPVDTHSRVVAVPTATIDSNPLSGPTNSGRLQATTAPRRCDAGIHYGQEYAAWRKTRRKRSEQMGARMGIEVWRLVQQVHHLLAGRMLSKMSLDLANIGVAHAEIGEENNHGYS